MPSSPISNDVRTMPVTSQVQSIRANNLEHVTEQLEYQLFKAQTDLNTILPKLLARLETKIQDELLQHPNSTSVLQGSETGPFNGLDEETLVTTPLSNRLRSTMVTEARRAFHEIVSVQRLAATRFHDLMKQITSDDIIRLNFPALEIASHKRLDAFYKLPCISNFENAWQARPITPDQTEEQSEPLNSGVFSGPFAQMKQEVEQGLSTDIEMAQFQIAISSNMVGDCIDGLVKQAEQNRDA